MSITCQAWCDECGRKLFGTRYARGPLHRDVFMTPEAAAGAARRLGWKVTSTRKRGTRTFNFTCPQCQEQDKGQTE